jgi:hypothetical protein
MADVRGDHVGWFNGNEEGLGWEMLPTAMQRCDTLVNEIGVLGGEARHVKSRSKAMCAVYPGGGSRYIRHVDNPDKNGRLITALLYLNTEWEEGDGGELRLFRCLKDRDDAKGFTDCDGRSLVGSNASSSRRHPMSLTQRTRVYHVEDDVTSTVTRHSN